jgi:hypothetical protein
MGMTFFYRAPRTSDEHRAMDHGSEIVQLKCFAMTPVWRSSYRNVLGKVGSLRERKQMMRVARLGLNCMVVLASCLVSIGALAADTDRTFTGGWRQSDDIVTGWDWSLPPGVKPAEGSGIFNLNSNVPANFPGFHLKQVNATWSELEPVEGRYDFSSITSALNDRSYDGVLLNVRGMVVSIVDANGRPALPQEITAPIWLSQSAPKVTEPLRNGVHITNLQIYDSRVKSKLLQLIKAIGSSGIPGHERLVAQIIHGVSGSRGEECCTSQNNANAVYSAMHDIITAWTDAYGPNARKLAWLKEDPTVLFDAAVKKGGAGMRGGIIENWVRNQYTPGDPNQTGQIYDDGYLLVDEGFAPIAQGRAWIDENEVYDRRFSSQELIQQNYRMATLRSLQMRRSIMWTEKNSVINPSILNWMSLGLGKNSRNAPDAWVALMRTWTLSEGEKEVKNLERWLYQRDRNGVMTSPAVRKDHGFNASGNDLLNRSKWNVDLARTGRDIGIAVDDRFLSGGPHDVAIKVTFLDSSREQWSLEYAKADGTVGSRKVQGGGTDMVRTATFFIGDFEASKSGMDFDFWLRSAGGTTPFMFVRLVKLEQAVANSGPRPPDNIAVE